MYLFKAHTILSLTCILPLALASMLRRAAPETTVTRLRRRPIIHTPILDTCTQLSTNLSSILPSSSEFVYGDERINQCLCMTGIPDYLASHSALRNVMAHSSASSVQDAFKSFIIGSGNAKHCMYPPHSIAVCTKSAPCGFTCTDGFTLVKSNSRPLMSNCECQYPRIECNGRCGNFPGGCPTPVLRSRASSFVSPIPSTSFSHANVAYPPSDSDVKCSNPRESVCGTFSYGGPYECINTYTSLEQCGGCANPSPYGNGEETSGVDCSRIDGVRDVSCQDGRCVVEDCDQGYRVSPDSRSCERTSTEDDKSTTPDELLDLLSDSDITNSSGLDQSLDIDLDTASVSPGVQSGYEPGFEDSTISIDTAGLDETDLSSALNFSSDWVDFEDEVSNRNADTNSGENLSVDVGESNVTSSVSDDLSDTDSDILNFDTLNEIGEDEVTVTGSDDDDGSNGLLGSLEDITLTQCEDDLNYVPKDTADGGISINISMDSDALDDAHNASVLDFSVSGVSDPVPGSSTPEEGPLDTATGDLSIATDATGSSGTATLQNDDYNISLDNSLSGSSDQNLQDLDYPTRLDVGLTAASPPQENVVSMSMGTNFPESAVQSNDDFFSLFATLVLPTPPPSLTPGVNVGVDGNEDTQPEDSGSESEFLISATSILAPTLTTALLIDPTGDVTISELEEVGLNSEDIANM